VLHGNFFFSKKILKGEIFFLMKEQESQFLTKKNNKKFKGVFREQMSKPKH